MLAFSKLGSRRVELGSRTLLAVAALFVHLAHASKLTEMLSEKAVIAETLAARMKTLYSGRCDEPKCADCTEWACSDMKNRQTEKGSYNPSCVQRYGTANRTNTDDETVACSCPGWLLNEKESAIRLPEKFSSKDKLTPDMTEFICASKKLDKTFVELQEASPSDADGKKVLKWSYFGSTQGIFRSFPGASRAYNNKMECAPYDPRERPWYVAATSGAKNVILVIDVSGSMSTASRLQLAKEAAKKVVSTLTNADWLNIVQFDTGASAWKDKMQRVTQEVKDDATKYIEDLSTKQTTNYQAAFDVAFEKFQGHSTNDEYNACENVVLFLTDGEVTAGLGSGPQCDNCVASGNCESCKGTGSSSSSQKLLTDYITDLNQPGKMPMSKPALMFTFTIGGGVQDTIPKQIACSNRGVYTNLADGADLVGAMSSYYTYLAYGLNRKAVTWTEPYLDSSGLGMMTTAALPAYMEHAGVNGTVYRKLIGVAGVDVTMDEFGEDSGSQALLNAFVSSSQTCGELKLDNCTLEWLRSPDFSSERYMCDPDNSPSVCAATGEGYKGTDCPSGFEIKEDPVCSWARPSDLNAVSMSRCCLYDKFACDDFGALMGVIFGPVGIALLIILLICHRRRQAKKSQERAAKSRMQAVEMTATSHVVVTAHPVAAEAPPSYEASA